MALWHKLFDRWSHKAEPLPAGMYTYKTPEEAPRSYRLHLRLEPDGHGLLLINAATVLHLNPTAAEYAYHLVHAKPRQEVAGQVSRRYRVSRQRAAQDYAQFVELVDSLLDRPDLNPVSGLEIDRRRPYSGCISAPYRLDCALTYPSSEHDDNENPSFEGTLTTAEWQIILDKAWTAGIPHVVFCGGEPTLRPDLVSLLGYAENLGMVTGLVTTGLRLDDSAYLDALLRAGLDHVMIVLRPDREHAWESLTGIAYWSQVLEADLHVAAHLTITEYNAPQALTLLERLASTGIHAVSLSANHVSLAGALGTARDRAALLDLNLVWDLPVPHSSLNPVALESDGEEVAAGAGRAWLYVEPNGDVLPAQGLKPVLGNFVHDPWEKIWPSDQDN